MSVGHKINRFKERLRDSPGGLLIKNPLSNAGDVVQSLVEELRSHKPHGATKKEKEKNNYVCQNSSRSYSFIYSSFMYTFTH